MVNHSTTINKTNNSHFNFLSLKKPTPCDDGNPGPDLEQEQICGGVKSINGISTASSW
jgi:hypothetical protein